MSLHLDEDGTMEIVMRNIYTSCDPENSNLVPVRKIIDFITPYMLDNSSALESLRAALDPENNNVCISSEQFYEVMNDWTKKIAGSSEDANSDFNNTPNQLDVLDEKQLPYIQSTPRASFGQKLLSCEGLLNLSNVSTYSLSNSVRTKDSSTVGAEKTILEEEIKRLEHQLSKITNELINVKLQLTVTEEQNEVLQTDLDRCKTRLHSEQQIIEHLQNDKRYNDELREELNASKKQIEELSKKLLQSEKDNHHLYGLIEQTEKEVIEQDAKKEIIDIKTELDLKDQEVVTVLKINDELKLKLGQQKDLIDQLTNENELLNHNKDSLEKALKGNLSARRDSLVSQYKTCLADSCSFPSLDQSNEEECYFKIQEVDNKNFVCDSLQAEISQVSLEKSKSRCSISPLDAADLRGDHKDNIAYYEQQINEFQLENAKIKSQLELVNKENEELQAGITEMRTKTLTLEKYISTLMKEMQVKEDLLAKIKREKNDTENEMKTLKKKNLELMDENSNLLDTNKAVGGTLEAKNKLLLQLDEKLLELKREVTSLHMENLSKEKELCEHRSKFNFEAAFKKLQMELNQKTKEVNDTENSNEELKEVLNTATRSNQELRQSLRQTKLQLKEYQEKSNQMSTLNENIENTASQVQLHLDRKNSMITELVELNKKFELNVNKLQQELQAKIKEVTDLRDCLKSDKEIRNIMWRDNKELTNINMKLTDELEDIKDKNKQIEIEYNMLLSKYNEETDNNKALMKQSERLSSVIAEHEEANKPLFEQVVTMRNEVDSIIVGQNEYKAGITKKLSKYEDLINKLETDLQEVKKQNDRLKEELENERIKTKRGILFDANVAPSESYKNRSFEKQKLSIDRLKEKLENVEVVLQNEKKKNEQLRAVVMEKEEDIAKNIVIQCGLEQAQKKCLAEKQVLEGVVDELKGKVKSLEECYKKLEYASSEKETVLSSNLSLLEDHNKQLCNELTNKNLLFNNTVIENETYKNYIASMDKRLQEYSGNISTCMYQLGEKEEEIKRCLAEIAEKNEWNACLMSKVTALELQNKSLQETLSKSDDRKEKELIEVEQKLKNTCRLLQCSEMELSLIQKKICDAKEEFNLNKKEVANMKDVISSGLNELSRVRKV
ncbi:hypothetical protein NQ318_017714 [Aromia moschata]|uniref:Uncharacterized protein n=1 Tax=Aromia moschata TaxID=1265417 RepID=A0AAV8XQ48_9CUCU|nr:hypothetical protein NQ318_017714 [Aromia moschata]